MRAIRANGLTLHVSETGDPDEPAMLFANSLGTDLRRRLPVLAIGGSAEGASPPDQVRAMADAITGASCLIIEGAGHLPCVEAPAEFASILVPFRKAQAHV